MGGRYISTDNAYVGAQKVLITPDISGKVSRVLVQEGQHVAAGDDLFEIDPVPFRLAVTQAQSKLDSVRTDFANLKSNYRSLATWSSCRRRTSSSSSATSTARTRWSPAARPRSPISTRLWRQLVTATLQSELGSAAARHRAQPACSAIPTCRSRTFRPISRPRPRSNRRSATSTTPSSRRRSTAPQRRSTTSSSAVSSPPARRCSA